MKNLNNQNRYNENEKKTFSFSNQFDQIIENILVMFFMLFKTLFGIVEMLVHFVYKYRKAVITILIIAVDIAILIPAVRLMLFSMQIGIENDLGNWIAAEAIKVSRQAYVSSNLFAGWLHGLGGSFLGTIFRLGLLLSICGINLLWFSNMFKKKRRRPKRRPVRR